MNYQEIGFLAENIAARHLKENGYDILDKNYRKPWGEIDIIAKKVGVIIFVEVKSSSREVEGMNPEVRVDWRKIKKIKRTAYLYLEYELGDMDCEWQIDVVSVIFDSNKKSAHLK